MLLYTGDLRRITCWHAFNDLIVAFIQSVYAGHDLNFSVYDGVLCIGQGRWCASHR